MEKGDHQSEVLYLEFPWITSGSLPALHEVETTPTHDRK